MRERGRVSRLLKENIQPAWQNSNTYENPPMPTTLEKSLYT